MAIMVGTGRGASEGVLVKHAEALERLEKVDTIVVDKTGTLTEGKPKVVAISTTGMPEADLLRLAAAAEQGSEHPLAAAVLAEAKARGLTWTPGEAFQSITGKGVRARVGASDVLVGNWALLHEHGIDLTKPISMLYPQGATPATIHVAVDGRFAGVMAVTDPIKAGARESLDTLRAEGLRVVMLTGDAKAAAHAVGELLGFAPGDIHAEVLPGQKRDVIRELQSHGAVVAMAGDGINDAPALAEAAVGIAMGTGTDVAIESAGITLVTGDLRALVRARRLSRATMRNIRQNLFLAFAYNVVGVPVAAGALYPFLGVLVSPIWASAAMTLSSLSVIANALRLRR
jgi:Cu+-exporting ATPase